MFRGAVAVDQRLAADSLSQGVASREIYAARLVADGCDQSLRRPLAVLRQSSSCLS
jgi:hypothetical protein